MNWGNGHKGITSLAFLGLCAAGLLLCALGGTPFFNGGQ